VFLTLGDTQPLKTARAGGIEVDELIIRSLNGRTTKREEAALTAWRASGSENEQRFQEIARLWAATAAIAPPLGRRVPTATSIIARAERTAGMRAPTPFLQRSAIRAAAIAAVLFVGVTFALMQSRTESDEHAAVEFVTGNDQATVARLSDGTVVRLGPGSRLRSSIGRNGREAWLEGTAFFAVAHDPARPLVVRTQGGHARVLGTRFHLSSRQDDLDLTVIEGRVALASGGDEVVVRSGEASRASRGQPPGPITPADLEASFRWLGGFVAFQSTPLDNVALELETRFGTPVRMADPAIGRITVTAWFADGSFTEVLSVVCRVADVRCVHREGTIWMER
jgi:transmembrane sensor